MEFRRCDHPILTLRVNRPALVTLTVPEQIDAGHVTFARQLVFCPVELRGLEPLTPCMQIGFFSHG